MNVVVGIQARMSSTRLPGKVMMDLCGKTLIQRVWDACQGPWRSVILTSRDRSESALCAHLEASGMEYRRGSLADVLSRYVDLARELRPDRLVRVCGDAPFIQANWIEQAVNFANGEIPIIVQGALHCGSSASWETAGRSSDPRDLEHAGFYWFDRYGQHLHGLVPADYITINTQEELNEARRRMGQPSLQRPNS